MQNGYNAFSRLRTDDDVSVSSAQRQNGPLTRSMLDLNLDAPYCSILFAKPQPKLETIDASVLWIVLLQDWLSKKSNQMRILYSPVGSVGEQYLLLDLHNLDMIEVPRLAPHRMPFTVHFALLQDPAFRP